jgi:hypothetical protein
LILSKFDSTGLDLGSKRLASLRDWFATTIKHRFNPFDTQVQSEYDFNVGLPDTPAIDLKDGYLTLKKYSPSFWEANLRRDIEGVFEPIFLQILELIRGQLNTVREKEGETIKVENFRVVADGRLVFWLGGWGRVCISWTFCGQNCHSSMSSSRTSGASSSCSLSR